MEPARLAASSSKQPAPQGPGQAPQPKGSRNGKKMLPRYPGWFSATFSGTTFFPVRPPLAGNSDLVVFWPILGAWHSEKSWARAENMKTQFPGAMGHFFGGESGRPKRFSLKFCSFFTFHVLGDRTPTGGESRNTGFWVHLGPGQPLARREIPGGKKEKTMSRC